MGLNATARTFSVSKKSVIDWERRLAELKPTLMLYALLHEFIWELHCGRKNQQLFEQALTCLAQVIEKTGSLNLLTDGERRYGNLLFEICHDLIRSGRPGRPKKRLRQGVRV